MKLSIDYNNMFIFLSIMNSIIPFMLDYNNIYILMIYFNSLGINYILYKDFKFEIKHKYSNINFLIMPNYYPSNRTFNKYLININFTMIYSGLILYNIDFWMNKYNINTNEYFLLLVMNIFIVSFNIFVGIILISYSVWSFVSTLKNYLTGNKEETNDYYCWICDGLLSKNKTLKKLGCPCQEIFHPDCIDKYLGLYNNYCRNGHLIAKYNHIV